MHVRFTSHEKRAIVSPHNLVFSVWRIFKVEIFSVINDSTASRVRADKQGPQVLFSFIMWKRSVVVEISTKT